MIIRETSEADLKDIMCVEGEAFGYVKEAELTRDILADPSATPTLSLLAVDEGRPVGHVLFSRVGLADAPESVPMSILAPLAIIPEYQGKGVGGALIKEGLRLLKEASVGLVFVLGHPGYYPRHGFEPVGTRGLEAPYPIPAEVADAWMVQALRPELLGELRGTVQCCDALNDPAHWRE